MPPGAGRPHIRRRGPLTERWCGTCSVWGAHATIQHGEAETAHVVSTDDQTVVSTLTKEPATVPASPPSTSTSSNEKPAPVSSDAHGDADSLSTLLLDFV